MQSKRPRLDKSCAGPSRVRRPVAPQHLDRPLDLAELVGIAAGVGVMAARPGSVSLLDRRRRGPAATEPRRMDPDVLEAEDAEGRGDALRLQVELAEVREDPAGLVPAFDAVALVIPPESAARPVVAAAGEAEEAIGHADASTAGKMAFRVGGGKGYFSRRVRVVVSFRSGPSVFKDQGKLSFDYLPDKMVHRDAQTQRLFSLLRPIVEAGASSNAFLYGPVGTGKTHTAKRFCLDFRKYASESNRALDWDLVNCRQRMGDDAVLLRLLQHFDAHFPERGFSIAEKMESLRKHLEKQRLHFIVILDEVDALLKKSGADLIYSFARIAEEGTTTKGNISMILISQRPNALEYMDAAALSTFRRTNVVEFPRYDEKELEDIVHGRVALAMHPGTVDDDLVDLIADIASEFGDARYAIELLEKAGMLADEERAEEVAAEHVRGAKAQVHPIEVEERLALLDVPKKLVLLSIARKSRKKAYITMGDAEQAYALVCEEYDEKPRAHTQFWKYVKELDALGLVDTKLSGKGEVGKTTLISLPEIPARVLADNLERSLKRR